jgi:tetratricopeptide (TPR) repeat protein
MGGGARELLARIIPRYEELRGQTRGLGSMLSMLGNLRLLHGAYMEAEEHLRRSLAILEANCDPDHPLLVGVCVKLANLHCRLEEYDRAEPLIERALASMKKRGFEGHDRNSCIRDLALVRFSQARATGSKELLLEALALAEEYLFFVDAAQFPRDRGGLWLPAAALRYDCLVGLERFEEAEEMLAEIEDSVGDNVLAQVRRAEAAERAGDLELAGDLYENATTAPDLRIDVSEHRRVLLSGAAYRRRIGDEPTALDLERRAAALGRTK